MNLPDRVRERVSAPGAHLPRVATEAELATAEMEIGFPLPGLLRELLGTVANGGFGPAEGLLGVPSDEADLDLVRAYLDLSADPEDAWPDRLLPVAYAGAETYFCIDCSQPLGRIVEFNPDFWDLGESECDPVDWAARPYPDHPTPACFRTAASSLEQFLETWLADGRPTGAGPE